MIQAGLAALGQGRPPLTDLDGGREGRHHGPVRQNPRNQGLRTAHFSGDVPSVHCCHTFICEAPGTAQTHTEHMRKAQSVPGPLWPSPAPTSPRPQVLRPEQALSLPVQLENRCGPAQTPHLSGGAPRLRPDTSAARGGPTGCKASAVPASPAPRPQASLPVHTGVGGHPHPVAPTRAVPAPQAEGSHRAGWMVGAGVARGAGPGDRKLSSPERAAPGRTGHTRPAAPQAWCTHTRGKEGRAGRDGCQGLAPAQRAECPQMAAALMAQQPAALAPGGRQLRSSGTRASPARRQEKLRPRPEAHACTYATPTHTQETRHVRQARPCHGQGPSAESLPKSWTRRGTGRGQLGV